MFAAPVHHSTFPASLDGAAQVARWLHGVIDRERFDDRLAFALEVCLEEVFTNVVRHGVPSAGDGDGLSALSVGVMLRLQPGSVDMVVEDNGPAFDMTTAPPRPLPSEDLIPGGLGLRLIRSFSSEQRYEATANGNRMTLKFLRAEGTGARPIS